MGIWTGLGWPRIETAGGRLRCSKYQNADRSDCHCMAFLYGPHSNSKLYRGCKFCVDTTTTDHHTPILWFSGRRVFGNLEPHLKNAVSLENAHQNQSHLL